MLFLETFIKRQKQVVNSPRLSPPVMLLPDTATPLQAQISESARRTLSSATAMPARLLLQHCSYTPVGVTNAYSRAYQRKPVSVPALRPIVGNFFVSLCLLLIICLHLLCLLTSCQGRANCLLISRRFPHCLLKLGQLPQLFLLWKRPQARALQLTFLRSAATCSNLQQPAPVRSRCNLKVIWLPSEAQLLLTLFFPPLV